MSFIIGLLRSASYPIPASNLWYFQCKPYQLSTYHWSALSWHYRYHGVISEAPGRDKRRLHPHCWTVTSLFTPVDNDTSHRTDPNLEMGSKLNKIGAVLIGVGLTAGIVAMAAGPTPLLGVGIGLALTGVVFLWASVMTRRGGYQEMKED